MKHIYVCGSWSIGLTFMVPSWHGSGKMGGFRVFRVNGGAEIVVSVSLAPAMWGMHAYLYTYSFRIWFLIEVGK
jgi:hypothetical protein